MMTANRIFAASALLCATVMAVAASAQSTPDAANPAGAAPPAFNPGDADGAFMVTGKFSEPDGEKLYRRVCAACHMPDAGGAVGAGSYPALANNPKLAGGAYPAYVVLKGLNGMPPLAAMMSDEQVAQVVNYVRTHFGNAYPEPMSAEQVAAMR